VTTETETVDGIIRRKAFAKLQQDINGLFEPLFARLPESLSLPRYVDNQGRRTTARGALEEVRAVMISHEKAKAEQAAVDNFVARHETLQAALDELRLEASSDKVRVRLEDR